jgi:threonine aldolase
MREAMYRAEVGDDAYGEDPTINRLEELAAERMGKEAALFVVSGTMGNLVAVLTHCGRGDEIILGDEAHIFRYEAGGVSALGGIMVHTVPTAASGMIAPDDVLAAYRADNIHFPRTRLICLENTHNRCGGRVLTADQMAEIKRLAERLGIAVHLDGARLYNAAAALRVDVRELAAQVDTVQFCFSKGLGAPVGSAICGSHEFIAAARRNRKLVGGGMRQAGVLAAACIVALEEMVERLADDHANAKLLAQGLDQVPGLSVDVASVETNIVMIEVTAVNVDGAKAAAAMTQEGMRVNAMDPQRVRAVTHYGVEREDILYALGAAQRAMKALA